MKRKQLDEMAADGQRELERMAEEASKQLEELVAEKWPCCTGEYLDELAGTAADLDGEIL